jgi:hypothetical protein
MGPVGWRGQDGPGRTRGCGLGLEEKYTFPLFLEIIFGAIIIPVKSRKMFTRNQKILRKFQKILGKFPKIDWI